MIIICFLHIKSATINMNSIKATCKPSSGMNRNSAEVSEQEIVEEVQQQIIEESTSIAAEETASEPELLKEPTIESVGDSRGPFGAECGHGNLPVTN